MTLACHREPSHNLFRNRIRSRGDLLRRLVLDGMLHVDSVKACASQGAGLNPRWSGEFSGCNRNCGNAKIF